MEQEGGPMSAGYKDCIRCVNWSTAALRCTARRKTEFADDYGDVRCTGYRCDVERAAKVKEKARAC